MSEATEIYPPLPSRIGKRGTGRMPLGEIFHWKVLDEVRCFQTNLPSKVLCLERILFEEENRIEVRLGYYIIGKKPRMKGKWVWGQYAAMLPVEDFQSLIQQAQ